MLGLEAEAGVAGIAEAAFAEGGGVAVYEIACVELDCDLGGEGFECDAGLVAGALRELFQGSRILIKNKAVIIPLGHPKGFPVR